jgi:6-phosphogluconolactonase (cycloisomerase 2 family)
MFRTLPGLLAIALAAAPARADQILYATAATAGRIDGFCLHDSGSLVPTPRFQVSTGGLRPRRLLVANNILYVAETDRVEAYRIGTHGGLVRVGSTKVLHKMHPDDLELSPDGTVLYVPQRALIRVAAYRLGPDGAPENDFSSCIQGPIGAGFSNLLVHNGLLYVSSTGSAGSISIFKLGADGSLPSTGCHGARKGEPRTEPTTPYSHRTKLRVPESFLINGDLLYVEQRVAKRIAAYRLEPDGGFTCPTTHDGAPAADASLKCPCPAGSDSTTCPPKKLQRQKSVSRTGSVFPYTDLILVRGPTLLGSQFFHGRIDAYRLKPDGSVPKAPNGHTTENLRTSPVRMTVRAGGSVLYVAAGEDDRVQAYRLDDNGVPDLTPFSETDVQDGSFPNDVAIAMLGGGCG